MYSLSRNYQLKENVVATMRLILPLDVSNAALYIAFTVLIHAARQLRFSLSLSVYYSALEWVCIVSTVYPVPWQWPTTSAKH